MSGFFEFLTEEQRALASATRDYARAELLPLDRTCDRNEESICQALGQMAEMGLMSLRLPEDLGGLACSRLPYAAIIHELAWASPSASVTISVHNMVGDMLLSAGSPRICSEILPQWGTPHSLGAFAISEADAGSDPSAGTTRATLERDTWTINGGKMWITNAAAGRWYVTLAQTAEIGDKNGLCMILVDGEQSGFERIKIIGKMGIRGSDTFSLHLTDVTAPRDALLSDIGHGMRLALGALDGGRIGIAAQATGIAEACIEEMVSYCRQRVQFGQPIARFQALQQMVADSVVELEAAKLLIARACDEIDRGGEATSAAAAAKLYASEMAGRVADRAVQAHGGSGYVNDARVEQLYRDARVTRIYEGTSEIQRLVIARDYLKSGALEGRA